MATDTIVATREKTCTDPLLTRSWIKEQSEGALAASSDV